MPQSEIIFSVQESPEGGYEARALGHSIFSQADMLEELKAVLRDAVACHFSESEKPALIRLHMVKDEVVLSEDPNLNPQSMFNGDWHPLDHVQAQP